MCEFDAQSKQGPRSGNYLLSTRRRFFVGNVPAPLASHAVTFAWPPRHLIFRVFIRFLPYFPASPWCTSAAQLYSGIISTSFFRFFLVYACIASSTLCNDDPLVSRFSHFGRFCRPRCFTFFCLVLIRILVYIGSKFFLQALQHTEANYDFEIER